MSKLRYLFAIALVCCLTRVAKADDFQAVVVDPPPPPAGVTTYDITYVGESLTVPWSACVAGELPTGTTGYVGCISLLNDTSTLLTNLELIVPDTLGVVGQTASCPTDPNQVFANLDCDPNPVGGNFTLDFSGPPGVGVESGYFVIAEVGADPASFPDTTVATGTPEPSSILLMSTGVFSLGLFAAYRRRHILAVTRPPTAPTLD